MTHSSSGLENLHDLSVNSLPTRCVASCLDRVYGIERTFTELLGQSHEISLDERNLSRESRLLSVLGSASDLESVVVDTDD